MAFAVLFLLTSSQLQAAFPAYDHVVIVVEENHSSQQIIGNAAAPYINSLAQQGAHFTNSYATRHPSQPNYLDLFSGSNQGVTTNNISSNTPFSTPNLGAALLAAGKTFCGYSDGLPSEGSLVVSYNHYYRKHNPWSNWQGVGTNRLPSSSNKPFTAFPTGNYAALPTLSFVVPDQMHDMHDGTIQQADDWLRDNLDGYIQWAKTHNSLFILTWDEDDHDEGNHIPTVFVGANVVPGQYGELINHFNVLRTLEDLHGLTHSGAAATATPITSCWNSGTPQMLTVNSGTGDGSYPSGTTVSISADAAPAGQFFDKWTGEIGIVADITQTTTTLVMPDHAVTVTATYKAMPEPSGVLVEECFEYTGTSVVGKNGGMGWGGAWTMLSAKGAPYNDNTLNATAFMDYPLLTERGIHMRWWTATGTNPQKLKRSFQAPIADDGRTWWMAFEIQASNQKVRAGLWLNGYSASSLLSMYSGAIGSPSYYLLDDTSTGASANRLATATTANLLFVFRIQMSGVTGVVDDVVTAFVNPDLSADPATWTAKAARTINLGAGITGITLASNNNANTSSIAKLDEFRVAGSALGAVGIATTAPAAPVAMADAYSANSNQVLVVPAAQGVLANDTDANGDSLSAAMVDGPQHGVLNLSNNGSFTYTPTMDYFGADGFTYVASDDVLQSAVQTVSLTVNQVIVLPVLTVDNGSGAGSYATGTVVNITANAAPPSFVFDVWTGDISVIADITQASTSITMPSFNVSVTATYKSAPTYTLQVNSGSGDGTYAAGIMVGISADAAPVGQVFDQWTGDTAGIANVLGASTTLTMPSSSATVSAIYKAAPVIAGALISDAFDYTQATLFTQNGGNGWATPWVFTGNSSFRTSNIVAGAMMDYPLLPESGNHMKWWTATGTNPQALSRSFTTPVTDDGQAWWLAFELQSFGQKLITGLHLNGYASAPLISIVAAATGASVTMLDGVQIAPASTGARLFVFKIQMSGVAGTDDVVTAYLNPNLAQDAVLWTPAAVRTIALTSITGITLKSNNNAATWSYSHFDEFRVGNTWQSVVGIQP